MVEQFGASNHDDQTIMNGWWVAGFGQARQLDASSTSRKHAFVDFADQKRGQKRKDGQIV